MIILTGGAGFIGSCFLRKLNDNKIKDIIVVDNLGSSEKWKNLRGKVFSDYVQKSIFIDRIKSNFYKKSEIDAIIHLGACSTTTETNADYIFDNNYQYSKTLAKFALNNDIKFIYASSAATYGKGEQGYSDNNFYPLKPMNLYGYSKQVFDIWVLENKLEKVLTGFKFFNVFGPNEYHKGSMASMVYHSFNQITSSGRVKLFKSNDNKYNNGEQLRDFIYVKDINEVLWKTLNLNNIAGIFNLGTGRARSWNDLVYAVFNAMNIESNIEYIEMPDKLKNQYQNYTCADMNKIIDNGINNQFQSLEDSIQDYIQGHLAKEDKYY